MAESKEFYNSYSSAYHFALVLQLNKKDNPLALTKFFIVRTSGEVDSLDSAWYQAGNDCLHINPFLHNPDF